MQQSGEDGAFQDSGWDQEGCGSSLSTKRTVAHVTSLSLDGILSSSCPTDGHVHLGRMSASLWGLFWFQLPGSWDTSPAGEERQALLEQALPRQVAATPGGAWALFPCSEGLGGVKRWAW